MENPLPNLTWEEQAAQFKVDVIGPLEDDETITSILDPLGFECHVNWMKQQANGEWLEVMTVEDMGLFYLLVYNRSQLSKWRRYWKARLRPDEPDKRTA